MNEEQIELELNEICHELFSILLRLRDTMGEIGKVDRK